MNSTARRRGSLAVALWLAPFAFLGGFFADRGVVAFAKDNSPAYRQLDVFAKVLSYVENNYVEPVLERDLVFGAIKGMLDTLDPHSMFMPPEIFKEMKVDTQGEFGGLGIEITRKADALVVVAPIDDTPASRAGVKAGDRILKIDGEATKDMDLPRAVQKMRGPPGSKVILTLMRDGFTEPRDIPILRDHIRIVSVESKLFEGRYGYVKIKNFQDRTDRYLKKALDDVRSRAQDGQIKGLVLDLRNNPGGLLDQAVRVADRFLAGGLIIVTTKGRTGRHVEEEKSHDRDTEPPYPMIVLVNGGSASASEIVAGALQDHGRAVIMGTQTFGKGSVQTVIELEDGSGLKLTIARYYTPKGRSIQEKGIVPDVVVQDVVQSSREDKGTREVDLKGHMRNEEEEPKAPQAPAAKPGGTETEDFQLKTAIDYLKTWQIFQSSKNVESRAASAP